MTERWRYGWFVNLMPTAWKTPWAQTSPDKWLTGEFYIEMARMLESAGVDFIMLEDSVTVPDTFGGSMDLELMYTTRSPKNDPIPLASAIAAGTRHLGIVVTMSTTLYPPWMLARVLASLDHLSRGRIGWNVVTSAEDRAVQNFGMDQIFEHDHRYERAHEYLDLVRRLWAAWEPDALVMDRGAGRYVDHATPIVGETMAEAQAKAHRMYDEDPDAIMRKLALMSSAQIDYSTFDLDAPLPDIPDERGGQSIVSELRKMGPDKTLRQLISGSSQSESLTLIGTPESIVDQMEEAMDTVGGDGFLFFAGGGGLITRHYLTEILDGLMPELSRRGLARDSYPHELFRDNLLLP